jgi:hypothetical protein
MLLNIPKTNFTIDQRHFCFPVVPETSNKTRTNVCGPAAITIERLQGKDKQNLLGGGPSNGVNVGTGLGGPPVAMEIACRQVSAQSSGRDSNIRRFMIDLSKSKDIVYNVKTLLNNDIGLTLWRRGEMKRFEWNERQVLRI